MRKRMRTTLVVLLLVMVGLAVTVTDWAAAQAYPVRPITMIVPWAAGGGTDSVARMVATLLERELGQPVNVVNRTGGGGAIGHTAIATARPDGYTIGMATVEITMMHWMGLAQVKPSDLRAVAQVNYDPAAVSVRVDAPWQTFEELIEYAKAHPGELKASGTGRGGIWDLARAGLLNWLGLPEDTIPWVPSEGAAPALAELVAGGVDLCTCSLVEASSLIRAGRVRPLLVMSDVRDPQFPDVPTTVEKGIDWSLGAWRGITVPKNTPDHIVAVLEAALERVYNSQEFQDFMKQNGFGLVWRNAEEFDKFMAENDEAMGAVMRTVGLAQ